MEPYYKGSIKQQRLKYNNKTTSLYISLEYH